MEMDPGALLFHSGEKFSYFPRGADWPDHGD